MGDFLAILRALSEPTRLRVLLILRRSEVSVAELQFILDMGQSRISTNLAQLRRLGLVTDRRVGKNSFYSVNAKALIPFESLLLRAEKDLPEAEKDIVALGLAQRKRKDRAGEYFNQLAGKFGRTYIPGRSWQGLAHALLKLLSPMVIADMGAGEGMLSQLLARNAKKVIAIDNSPKMVEFGVKLAREHELTNLEYRLGDIEAPPIANAEVDLALFSQALHHASEPLCALREAYRILQPGGRILILDLASHSQEEARELYAHVWLGFAEAELYEMLRDVGFSNIEVNIVAREKQAPHFQTLLATGYKAVG
ncbi:MAG: metalloregulator ArsR/SmtB family transcription factor [Chthoniobacterales bacterium]